MTFFLLVFALSTPIRLLGAVTRRRLSADLPVSSFVRVCPVVAASLLVYRESGRAGVARLLRRSFDHRRIRDKRWYLPTVLLLPGVYAGAYGVLWLTGAPLPAVRFSVLAAAAQFAGYLVAAEAEELGWSGYALDPLQVRWSALRAGCCWGWSGPGSNSCRWSAWPVGGLDRLVVAERGGAAGAVHLALQQHRPQRVRGGAGHGGLGTADAGPVGAAPGGSGATLSRGSSWEETAWSSARSAARGWWCRPWGSGAWG